jgi:uncharacterized tellurite resistance protein B-like protein
MPLSALKELFRGLGAEGPEVESRGNPVHLATAAILLELAHADQHFSEREEAQLIESLKATFGLDDELARRIIGAADESRGQTIDHWSFTNAIRQNTDRGQRMEIVREMWRMVFADGRLHDYEEYLIRKLSDLLGIQHHEMIEAKLSVRKELAGGGT